MTTIMPPMQALPLLDGPLLWAGAVSLETRDGAVRPWRVPVEDLPLFEPTLRDRAGRPAGVRITFQANTRHVELDAQALLDEFPAMPFDLLVDGRLHQRQALQAACGSVRFVDLPAGDHRIEIYLPQMLPLWVRAVRIDADATAAPWPDARPKWTVYGSSITQCAAAAGPSETWPALVANSRDLNLTCLGYGGNCHGEPMVARLIRDLPADYISLCFGINVIGGNSLSERTFRAAVIGLVQIIREKHPATPMVVVSPIASPPRESATNKVNMNLQRARQFVAEAVDVLRQRGDERLAYADGLELFGPDLAHLMPDLLHPNAEGYRVLASRYDQLVMPKLGFPA